MHDADGGIAIADLIAQDPHADQVVDIVEVAALDDHLLIDRPVVLGPALHGRTDLHGAERGADIGAHPGQVGVPRGRPVSDQPNDFVITFGMQDRE